MTIYLVMIFISLLMGIGLRPNVSTRGKKIFLWSSFFILTIISGLRAYSVGADTRNYVSMFDSVEYIGILNTRIEIGFMTYLKFLHIFSDDPRIMLFASSIICVGAACLFTYKFSKDPAMSICLYLLMGSYFSQMNTMRQAIALSFCEIAFMVILTKSRSVLRNTIAGIIIAIAFTMHNIAIVAFIPYALIVRSNGNKEKTDLTAKKALLQAFGLAMIGFAGYSLIMNVTVRIFPAYAHYFSGSRWSDVNYNASLFNTLIAVVFASAGMVIFRNKPLNNTQRFAAIMLGLSIVFNVLSMRMEIWNRIAGMFSIYTYLLWVPEFISKIRGIRNRWILKTSIFMFALAYMLIVLIFRPEWTQVVPYMLR